jgi:hypothetical protein
MGGSGLMGCFGRNFGANDDVSLYPRDRLVGVGYTIQESPSVILPS